MHSNVGVMLTMNVGLLKHWMFKRDNSYLEFYLKTVSRIIIRVLSSKRITNWWTIVRELYMPGKLFGPLFLCLVQGQQQEASSCSWINSHQAIIINPSCASRKDLLLSFVCLWSVFITLPLFLLRLLNNIHPLRQLLF